jgi:hypothetical protein
MWQRVLWDAMEELAGPGNGALVAELSRPLLDYVDVISDFVTESVEDIQAALRLTQREGRREVMEALLAGRPAGPQALAAGLDDDARVVVLTAREVGHLSDPAALSVAAVTLARAPGDAVEPLFAVCGEEIVMVRATAEDPARLVELLTAARKRLAAEGIHLAVGVSAVHDGLAQIPAAYDEACMARGQATGAGGLLALAVLGPLDYLFLRGGDDTAWALVDPTIRTFVEQDLSQAGLLIHTLMAYVDCSLNVKLAAERLFVHPNTAHYRLSKIEEITGRDLRNLVELQDLVIAVRLARHLAAR